MAIGKMVHVGTEQKVKSMKDLPRIEETILRKRKRSDQRNRLNNLSRALLSGNDASLQKFRFKRAEQFVREYRRKERALIQAKRILALKDTFVVEDESKIAVVIRVRGNDELAPHISKILRILRLEHKNDVMFVKLNSATVGMLKVAESCITWGYPNVQIIRELLTKRAFVKVKGKPAPLTDNAVIEERLGQYGMVCFEDLVQEIYLAGSHLSEVTDFFWSFRVSGPKGGWQLPTKPFDEGGDYGNRKERINELLKQII